MHTLDYANQIESLEGKPIFFFFFVDFWFLGILMSEMRTIKNVKEILRDTNNNVKICKECQSMRALDYANQTNSLFLFF